MNLEDPDSVREDDAAAVAERARDLRRAILQHPDDESRPATAGEVAAALALVERLAALTTPRE